MMKLLLSLFLVFLVTDAKDKTCPALPTDKFDVVAAGDAVLETDDCEDLDKDCAACADQCEVVKYTDWMATKCPKTCGFCTERNPMDSLMSGVYCWKRGQKPNGVEIKRVPWKTFKDCEEECIKTKGCVAAMTSDYMKNMMECVLLGATSDLQCGCSGVKKNYLGAQRSCFEASPLGYCEDAWYMCGSFSTVCYKNHLCYRNLLSLACQGTCKKCPKKPAGSPKLWRETDRRCGKHSPLWTGAPGQCDGNSINKCCAPWGWCGNRPNQCNCKECIDYSKIGNSRLLE